MERRKTEAWLLTEKIRAEQENSVNKDKQIAALQEKLDENEAEIIGQKDETLNSELIRLNDLVAEAEIILIEKEKEISWLTETLQQKEKEIKVKIYTLILTSGFILWHMNDTLKIFRKKKASI